MIRVLLARNVITAVDSAPLRDGGVAVDGDKIISVASAGELRAKFPENTAEFADLGESTLMPGFIDAHLHTSFNGEPGYWDIVLKQTTPYRTLTSLKNVQRDLMAGFTSVRVLGEKSFLDIGLKKAINDGVVWGPRLVCAGQNLTVTGGHADIWLAPEIAYTEGLGGIIIDGPEEFRKGARQQIKAGADVVKLLVTGGVMSEGSIPGIQHMSYEEAKAAIDEAHRLGRKTSAHAQGTEGIKTSVRAGIDSIEHGYYLDKEGAQMMASSGTFFVPTLIAGWAMTKDDEGSSVPEYFVRKSKDAQHHAINAFQLSMEAGVQIAMGTDAGSPFNYHGFNAIEMKLMVDAGMHPMDVIKATTAGGAACLGLSDKVGTLESGKFADLVAVDGNPIENIEVCQKATFVMKGGTIYKRNGQPVVM